MSASLVGSEMCIRDRCRCLPLCAVAGCACWRLPPLAVAGCLGLSRVVPCLLYTSDAADDM
eukprot:3190596-Alexandrium_andersonii.AAC.1